MRFRKLIWPAIWSSLALCIVVLSFSICTNLYSIYQSNHPNSPPEGQTIISSSDITTTESDAIKLPIIMYHALIQDSKLQNKYFISPEIFENDLKYLNKKGYTAVTMTEVINYVYNGTPLPKKPIVISFDDGYYNNYVYAYPLLKKYNQKAVISIIGNQSDLFSLHRENNAAYSHLTWDQLNEMIVSGHVEVQNHTYDMHTYNKGRKGCMDKNGESYEVYKDKFVEDVGSLQQKITDYTGFTPNTMTYPFGFYSKDTEKVVKEMGFKASLTCSEVPNYITKDPECLYKLGRYLRPPDKSSADYFKKILDK
ncbi:MAG: polysaccharide deacetylase family protein [Aminipila sp.]